MDGVSRRALYFTPAISFAVAGLSFLARYIETGDMGQAAVVGLSAMLAVAALFVGTAIYATRGSGNKAPEGPE